MAKSEDKVEGEAPKPRTKKKPKKELKQFLLREDYPPKKKGEKILLSKEGEAYLKSINLI